MNRLPTSHSWNTQTELQSAKGRPPIFKNALLPSVTAPHAFFLPARYEKNYAYPLVVWLHDDGGCEQQVSQVLPHISVQNYVGVGVRGTRACDAAGHRYDWMQTAGGISQAEAAIAEAIENAAQRYSINEKRIFIAGYKSGGTMAQRIALRFPDSFAGVISLGGAFPRGCRPLANLHQARQLEILLAFATEGAQFAADSLVDDLRLMNAARMRVEVQQLAAPDEMMASVLRHMDQWMMRLVTGQSLPQCVPDCDTVPVDFSCN